jgi:3-oxoadipate enol-lactonase
VNPPLSALGAGVLSPHLVNHLSGERRQHALNEINRTSMTTLAAALVGASEFTSHEWIGQINVQVSVLVPMRDTIVPSGHQRRVAEAIPHATVFTVEGDHAVCVSDPARFGAKLREACLATQPGVIPPNRSPIRRRLPGGPRSAADAG